jgi:hypothetical protein
VTTPEEKALEISQEILRFIDRLVVEGPMTPHQAVCSVFGAVVGIGMAQLDWSPEEIGEIAERIGVLVLEQHKDCCGDGSKGPTLQ